MPGFPTIVTLSGTLLRTTLPEPIIAFSPMVIPGLIVAFAPIEHPFLSTVFSKDFGLIFDLGYLSLVKVALGPINTLSPTLNPSHK